MKKATSEKRLSSSHERIEINVSQQDDKDDILSIVSERIFSPGQLELQRKVALAQSSRKTEDIQPKNTSDTVREVRMAKSSYSHNKAAPTRRSRHAFRRRYGRTKGTKIYEQIKQKPIHKMNEKQKQQKSFCFLFCS